MTGGMRTYTAVRVFNAMLAVASLAAAASLAVDIAISRPDTPGSPRTQPSAVLPGVEMGAPGAFSRYERVGSGVFGRAEVFLIEEKAAAAPKAPRISSPPEHILLVGTAPGEKDGYAIFFDRAAGRHEVVEKGGEVLGLGRLSTVETHMAVVESKGGTLAFHMPYEKPPSADNAASTGMPGVLPISGAAIDGSTMVIDRRALESVLDNIGKALGDARLVPYMPDGDGRISGFRVTEIKKGSVFSLIGLREGDVLVRINDLPVDSHERGVQLLKGLRGESRLAADIVREGKPKKLFYWIR